MGGAVVGSPPRLGRRRKVAAAALAGRAGLGGGGGGDEDGGGEALLLAVLGEVFDVSRGAQFYGPGGAYSGFVGRDASQAFSTGAFKESGEQLESLEGLTAEQQKVVWDWRQFYRDHADYPFSGLLVGSYYDSQGRPTAALQAVEEQVALAEQAAERRDQAERDIPRCNLDWVKDRGGRVWCDTGFPRKVAATRKSGSGAPTTRCGCVPETLLAVHAGLGEVYPECSPTSRECSTG